MTPLNPHSIYPPFARYSHGVRVESGATMVFCSGQLGIRPDGTVPEGAEEQTSLCLRNIEAILAESEMTREHIVRLTSFVVDREHLGAYMAARDRFIAGLDPAPASTLMIVSGFARPEFLVEIEAIAALER